MATLEQVLREWTSTEAYERDTITYKANPSDVIDTMAITWPDGSAGIFITTDFVTIDYTRLLTGFRISHVASGMTVLQAPMTLRADGLEQYKPPLQVVSALSFFGAVPFGARPFGL